VLTSPAMLAIRNLRIAALAAAAVAIASLAAAQGLRLTRPAAWTPDSTVKAVVTGGSAQLTPNPAIDENVPRIWLTKAERTRWAQTADYEETMRYCRQLEGGSRWVKLESFGRTGQGRDLPLLIVSKDRLFTPEAVRASGKPVILIQNGIHSGEIEGKDAALMLVRDMAVLHQHEELLDSVVVLVVPMFSADAHERKSKYNRINQNGPDEMGWRHTPIGLNLNRDYLKLDAPEMRALIGNVYSKWWPELLIDDHTTDGADYQYDITYAMNHGAGVPAALDRWMADALERGMVARLIAKGHLVAPYLDFRGGSDPRGGIEFGNSQARFSTGYAPTQSRAALLVETHMLKPYGSRVKATYDLLQSVLEELRANPRALTAAVRDAEAEAVARATAKDPAKRQQVLASNVSDRGVPFAWKGVETKWEYSDITGSRVPRYSSTPWDTTVMLFRETLPALSVRVPAGGYMVPQEWTDVIDRLALHGIRTRRLSRAWSDTVELTRVTDYALQPQGYEGRQLVRVVATQSERRMRGFRAGDVWVPLDQRGGPLAVTLFEAQSPDGLLAWGFFNTIFQKKEYGGDYVVEPMARAMMAHDPKLAADFQAKLAADSAFAGSPDARTDWFYRRSPWADPEQDLHPIARALRPVPESYLVALPGAAPAPVAPRR
ncbi:MAG: M14 family metallopeptidase, partial [Candidatus Eisenbacteria bacterium]